MSRRKGELSTSRIDKIWPHQVALADPLGAAFPEMIEFCHERNASPRRHTYFDEGWQIVFCFATRTDAEDFKARFGGAFVDPKERPKWPGRAS